MKQIINKKNLLMLMFLIIGFTVGILSYKFSEEKVLGDLNSGYISKNAISFTLKEIDGNEKKLKFKDLNSIEGNITIYDKTNKYINRVYFKGKGTTPPIYEGSFFSDIDFMNNENIAVIGKNIKIDKTENGNNYVKLEDKYFRVIGYTGIKEESILDETIYLPVHENEYIENGMYVIEGNNTLENYLNLDNKLENGYILKKFNKEESPMNRIFKAPDINKILDSTIWIIFILSMLSISYYMVQSNKNKINVLNICGFSQNNIFRYCFMRIIVLSVLNYTIGIIISLIFISTFSESYIFKLYVFSLKNIFIEGIILYIIPIILSSKFFIKKELRGKKI